MEWLLVQILVVVANIQFKILEIEVERNSRTAIGHGLIEPIGRDVLHTCALLCRSTGDGVKIPQPGRGYCMAT